MNSRSKESFIDKFIKGFKPDLICFTAVFREYKFISKIAKQIKSKHPSIYQLIGGHHTSLNPEEVMHDSFDALCIGEGEYPTLELVRQIEDGKEPSGIRNLWIKSKKGIERNPAREFIRDLDSLPFPDRDMWQRWIRYPEHHTHVILIGRGCPFNCTYCCNHAIKKLAHGRYVRFRYPHKVVEEIKEILAKFPETRYIYFEIETIGANKGFGIGLCSELEKLNKSCKKSVTYGINLRVTPGSDYNLLFKAFREANFNYINIGLETGSRKLREKILGRCYSNQDIVRAATLARKYGINVTIYIMIGIPGEAPGDYEKTIRCVKRCKPSGISRGIFFPYPGTSLFEHCRKNGLLPRRIDTKSERHRAVLKLPGLSKKMVETEYRAFKQLVFYNSKQRSR